MQAVQIRRFGGPEVLEAAELPKPDRAPGHVSIRVSAAGVNYADVHTIADEYLISAGLPFVPGGEVVGRREDTGERVVALCGTGGYAAFATAPAGLVFPVPDAVDDGTALALLVQGVTAWHLLRTCARLAAGERVVVQAAAGGVGTLAVQLARRWGAGRIVGTASSAAKRALVLELGADEAVDGDPDGLTERIGRADVVLEMAGGRAFKASLAALAPFGRLVTYGNASREIKGVTPPELMHGSRAVIGFWLMDCVADAARLIGEPLAELFALAASGELRAVVGEAYPLADAARAHTELAARRTTGKLVLVPA